MQKKIMKNMKENYIFRSYKNPECAHDMGFFSEGRTILLL